MSETVRLKLSTWNTRLWFAMSARRRCLDIEVRLFLPGAEDQPLFDKVCEALGIIAQYSPTRLQRIRQDRRGLWITETAGNVAEYHHNVGLCLLDRSQLAKADVSPAHVAATIVHEATHARLTLAGFGYEPEMRARIENVCFRGEIAFASRLPDGTAIIEQARRQLERDPVVWTREAARDRATTKLRELGVPEWLIKLIIRVRKTRDSLGF